MSSEHLGINADCGFEKFTPSSRHMVSQSNARLSLFTQFDLLSFPESHSFVNEIGLLSSFFGFRRQIYLFSSKTSYIPH